MKEITYYEVHVYTSYGLTETECLASFADKDDANRFAKQYTYDDHKDSAGHVIPVSKVVYTSLEEAIK